MSNQHVDTLRGVYKHTAEVIAEALGRDRSMDPTIAEAALAAARMTVSDDIREGRFGPAVAIDDDAPAHDRLAAFLGRHPS